MFILASFEHLIYPLGEQDLGEGWKQLPIW